MSTPTISSSTTSAPLASRGAKTAVKSRSGRTSGHHNAPAPSSSAPVRRGRHQIVVPSLRIGDAAVAAVFAAARLRGPIARDVIAQVTSLSIATVNRQVTALLEAGLLRERADLSGEKG